MLKAKDLRNMSVDELKSSYSDHRKKLFDIINDQRKTAKSEKPHLIGQVKKEIAKMLTVLTEKEDRS